MSMGLDSAFGVNEFQKALRQRILENLAQEQQKFQNTMTVRGADRADRALNQQDELTRLKIEESKQNAGLANDAKQFTLAEKANEAVPAGTVFPSIDRIPSSAPIVGRLQMVGALQPTSGSLGSTTDTKANTATGTPPSGRLIAMPEGLTKLPSANQANVLADNARADAVAQREAANQPLEQVIGPDGKPTLKPRSQAAGMTPYHVPPHEPNPQPQIFKGPDGKDHAVQFVGGAAKEIPLPDGYRKPNATVDNRLASAQAVTQVGNDIIAKVSDPTLAAQLGPAMGRYNNLQEFIGKPPPEFAELAGDIESFSLANMGVHGMRSVQGADEIKKLLSGKHTPESLVAGLKGLMNFSNHFMENEGRKPVSGTKPTADELIKKYSK